VNTSLRTSALVAGISLALMALLAPLGLLIALPAGSTGVAALVVLVIAALDVVAGVALYPLLAPGGKLLAQTAAAMRVAYGAVFATAAGSLFEPVDVPRFQAIWDAGLLVFGVHLVLVGVAVVRCPSVPTWIGVLVLITGAGYVADASLLALSAGSSLTLSEFTFVGEVILMIWLIGWGGRTKVRRTGQDGVEAEVQQGQDPFQGPQGSRRAQAEQVIGGG